MAIIAPIENGKVVENTSSKQETKNTNDLGYDQFLQLLCAEMQYQDPLEPTSNTDYVAQLATFSQMESMLNMQNSMQANSANALVGKYVIVKSTSSATGETTADAGFVDYVQYENNTPYVCVNGKLYSYADIYEVADTDYMEAVALGEAFVASVNKLPNADKLTLADQKDVENLAAVYESLTSYQKSYISSDALTKYSQLVSAMKEIVANAKGDTAADATDKAETDSAADKEDTVDESKDSTTTE